ncbi:hypothetical protein [Sphingomicrobium marinum]|uniref:hypothetical protein n=1 Tax=Sphingomicrobium marinum TaxID=1227950 RepID=UPI00223F2C42|nr:hypothetical protein [Sphingomicrobium marinum]
MRVLIVALAIVAIGIGLLVWSGKLDDEEPAVQANENAQDRFELDSGMASENDPSSTQPAANETRNGP